MTSHQQEQKERRSLAGSTNETTTYRDIAARDLSLEGGGRYSQPTTIVGSTPTIRYPQASGPWTGGDPAGVEPPIGIDVSFVEPCGTAQEVASSIEALSSVVGSSDEASFAASDISVTDAREGEELTPAGFPGSAVERLLPSSPLPSSSSPTISKSTSSTPIIPRRKGL